MPLRGVSNFVQKAALAPLMCACDNSLHSKMKNLGIALTLFILLTSSTGRIVYAQSQQLAEEARSIRAAMDERDSNRAEALVRQLRTASPSVFTANNYDYLLARLSERRGSTTEAASLYQGVLSRGSLLSQYSLFRLATIARSGGDFALERQHLVRLLASYPSSTLAAFSRERLIDNAIDRGDYRTAAAQLRPIASPSGVRGRGNLAKLGNCYLQIGQTAEARTAFSQLIEGSHDDYALAAALGLDEIERAGAQKPSEFEGLRRARIYLDNRHWTEARSRMLDIINRFPSSPNRSEALYQTGFTYYREDDYDRAVEWFDRAHKEFPGKKDGEEGYYFVGTALQKARRYIEAAVRYAGYITAYPQGERLESAYRNLVDCYRYAGKDAEAIEWSKRMEERFAGGPLAVVGLFNRAKIELVRGRNEAALELFTRLQAHPVSAKLIGAPAAGEAAFTRIYILEQMGRLGEAVRLYLPVPEERDNYYSHRATARLQAIASTDAGLRVIEPILRNYKQQAHAAVSAGRYAEAKNAANQALRLTTNEGERRDILGQLRACYEHLAGYSSFGHRSIVPVGRGVISEASNPATSPSHAALAAELLFLSLYDDALPELRLAGLNGAGSGGPTVEGGSSFRAADRAAGDVQYSMAVYSNRGEQSHFAIAYAEGLLRSLPRDYRIELLPRDLAEMLYPAPYFDRLNRYCKPGKADPRLVLSLVRQESRFNPSVKRNASARGLLQFIPETAAKLAAAEKIENFKLDDVYDPHVAVRLASRYVSDLSEMFHGNASAIAGSYNTGEQNVERWIARAESNDLDRFFLEIAIPETKDYVAKVINNYWAYQQLYQPDLRPHSRF